MTDETQSVAKALRENAYRAGNCTDCLTEPHSPGRPRCTTCHQKNNPNLEPQANRNNYPCRMCRQATKPGHVLCTSCFKKLRGGKP